MTDRRKGRDTPVGKKRGSDTVSADKTQQIEEVTIVKSDDCDASEYRQLLEYRTFRLLVLSRILERDGQRTVAPHGMTHYTHSVEIKRT